MNEYEKQSPSYNHPDYPVGAKYRDVKTSDVFEVLEHGYSSIKITKTGWIGTNEIWDWLKQGWVERIEENEDDAIAH